VFFIFVFFINMNAFSAQPPFGASNNELSSSASVPRSKHYSNLHFQGNKMQCFSLNQAARASKLSIGQQQI
jgi:hypothetical protein